MLETLYY